MNSGIIKFAFVLLLYIFNCRIGFSQAPAWAWAEHNNVPYGAVGLVTDAAGNVYSAGLTFAKHSPSGTLLWSHQLQSPSQSVDATGLAKDGAGNLYLCGYFFGTMQLDTISLTSSGRKDAFVAKFNANGDIQWARKAGGVGPSPGIAMPGYIDDGAFAVAADSAGNCYIAGGYHNLGTTVWFDSISIPQATSNPTIGRAFVAKYNTSGKIQWVHKIDGPESYDIGLGPQDTYYIAQRDSGIKVSKFNNYGILSWSKTSSNNPDASNFSLCTDKAGNCFLTGSFKGNLIFGTDTLKAPANTSNVYLVKYGNNGTVQWARQNKGGSGYGEFVSADEQGNVFITGGLAGTATFGPGVQLAATSGSSDIFATKYNSSGIAQWAVAAGAGGRDYGQAIGALPNGDCYVAGQFNGFSSFGSVSLAGSGTYNFFVAKSSANPLGVPENKALSNFQFYPNPATSEVTIFNPNFRNAAVKIFNLAGQKVFEIKMPEQGNLTISTQSWPAGIYLVKLHTEEGVFIKKLLVNP